MPEPETLLEWILQEIACEKDLSGKKILITAGPTQESLDPVRYLTNHSTGRWAMRWRSALHAVGQRSHW